MDKLEKLKELENTYQISKNWNYKEQYTKQEYLELIGKYADYTPLEITDEICKVIKEL